MPMRPRVYLCPICNVLWLEHQLIKTTSELGNIALRCLQDGGKVTNASHTQRGKQFLRAVEDQKKRSPNVPSKV